MSFRMFVSSGRARKAIFMSIPTLVGVPVEDFESHDIEVRQRAYQILARNNCILSGEVGPATERELRCLEARKLSEPSGKPR